MADDTSRVPTRLPFDPTLFSVGGCPKSGTTWLQM